MEASSQGAPDGAPYRAFDYDDGRLKAEGADVAALADRFGTPLYVYSARTIRDRYARVRAAYSALRADVHYSVKANSNLALLRLLRDEGAGFDVVSGGEIERCLRAGVAPERIVFAGVGKTVRELERALAVGVGLIDVESADELADLARLASAARPAKSARAVRFALRLNPDVDAGTHEYVTTGLKRNKFGVPFDEAMELLARHGRDAALEFRGFHVHFGSQVTDPARFREAAEVAARRVEAARRAGFAVHLLNVGGGFAARYEREPPSIEAVAAAVVPVLAPLNVEVLLEPGRYVVAEAGLLVTRVLTVKGPHAGGERDGKSFVVVDAAMNDLIRPALYDAEHPITPVLAPPASAEMLRADVVGPVCESGDFLARDRELARPARGDLLAIETAGAYGFAMASQYNSRPRAAEVLVDGADVRLVRRRETIDDLLAPETGLSN
jgi:diaminopimelate decarboxylase